MPAARAFPSPPSQAHVRHRAHCARSAPDSQEKFRASAEDCRCGGKNQPQQDWRLEEPCSGRLQPLQCPSEPVTLSSHLALLCRPRRDCRGVASCEVRGSDLTSNTTRERSPSRALSRVRGQPLAGKEVEGRFHETLLAPAGAHETTYLRKVTAVGYDSAASSAQGFFSYALKYFTTVARR